MDYYCDASPIRIGYLEIALGESGVIQAVTQDLIASSANRVVLGLGATGLSCARYLDRCGIAFTVVDTRSEPPGLQELLREMPNVAVFLANIPDAVIEGASEIIVSPGLALEEPLVIKARAAGVAVVGDIDLFIRDAKAPVIGITGSNAKSTVTEWVGEMARESDLKVAVGGNLGTPALDLLADEIELYVLELSSFQLERAGKLNLAVATVLNVTADHLDWHGNFPSYHRAKHKVFGGCQKAVANKDDPLASPLVADSVEVVSWRLGDPELRGFGTLNIEGAEFLYHGFNQLMPVAELGLLGRHNVANALAALAIGHAAGLPMTAMVKTLRSFKGLPHRCQFIAKIGGVSYINDSKGTNPGATQAALVGLGQNRNIVLIAGGMGKGADFSSLQDSVSSHCKRLILIGEAAQEMRVILENCTDTTLAGSLEQAVKLAGAEAIEGDCVLLSPACASFDMFSGYAARGDTFIQAVAQLAEESQ